ncbi:MAG: hypothetical protein C0625_02860 [Arcobacter sp.]|nr:MAG: hypothetical protein C0625_02860 [Arcobacter sp.]
MIKTIYIYIILFLLTSITLFLGNSNSFTSTFTIIVFITTIIKGQLIIDYFMGLKNVKLKYRMFISLWLLLIVGLISIAYLLPIQR